MRVTPLGCQVPSSMVAGGPAASSRPPYFATMGPATFRYSWNPVGSVTSMSTTTYAAMSRLLLSSATSPVDEPRGGAGRGHGGSLDHLVRPRQHRRRDREPEGLGGLEIDDKLEFRGLLDGQIAWLGPLQNLVHVA